MSLTQSIREFALDLGYSRVGIIPFGAFVSYERELASRGEPYGWFNRAMRAALANGNTRDPASFAKSVIMLVWDYSRTRFPESLVGKVGRVYQARCYLPPEHRVNGARIALFRAHLQSLGCDCETDICLPDRWIGAMAGVTDYGRNTVAYAGDAGSFIVLKSVVVDKELDYDAPYTENPEFESKCPEGCRRCLDACPTGALYEPYKLNPLRCIAFNTFGRATPNGHIPRELRDKFGQRIHGCDICQEVCPRNRSRLQADMPQDGFLERLAGDFSLRKLLHLTDEFYQTRVQPIMYNYIREPWIFQRNAAVAIGNGGDDGHVPDLAEELDHPEEAVRSHAAWALGKLGGPKAVEALERRKRMETSEVVRQELDWALEMAGA